MKYLSLRQSILGLTFVAGTALFLTACQSQNTTPPPSVQTTQTVAPVAKNTIAIQNFAFSPATITLKAGDSITWTNQDAAPHTATADDGSFDTGSLANGQSKSITFSKPGTFTYHCSVHPNMKATIVVTSK